jgi:multidrug efflux pump subunit AcrB
VVFLPLISITGVNGVFFRALAVTVGMALLTSLALALTWTPTLSHYLIRSRGRRRFEGRATLRPPAVADARLRARPAITLEHKLVLAALPWC